MNPKEGEMKDESLSISRFCDIGLQCDHPDSSETAATILSKREDHLFQAVERRRSVQGATTQVKGPSITERRSSVGSTSKKSTIFKKIQIPEDGQHEKKGCPRIFPKRNSVDNSALHGKNSRSSKNVKLDDIENSPIENTYTTDQSIGEESDAEFKLDFQIQGRSSSMNTLNVDIIMPIRDSPQGRRNTVDNSALATNKNGKRRGSIERALVEIQPGLKQPLRLALETESAIRKGFVRGVGCTSCEVQMFCIKDAKFMLCPLCRVITAVECDSKAAFGVGLGIVQNSIGVGLGVVES